MNQNRSFLVIAPCQNEEHNIKKFIEEINFLKQKNNYNLSLLLVDDGSTDKTWETINQEKKNNYNLKAIKLSKNFGKDSAIDAGINYANEDYDFYIIIDSDLQHPIEKIKDLIKKHDDENYKIVTTHRIDLKEGFYREFFSNLFYKILSKISDVNIISKTTDFMLISKNVREQYLLLKEKNKSFRVLINWIGFKKTSLPININLRKYGKSKFNFIVLLRLALNVFSSFSIFPIKIIAYFGCFMSLITFLFLLLSFSNFFLKFTVISYQTNFIVIQIFLTGLTMTSVGLLGLYVSKILDNTNNRPNYIIEEEIK